MQINKIRYAKEITINTNDIENSKTFFKSLYYMKLDNVKEMVIFLEAYDLPK